MIARNDIFIGARIIENDPEDPSPQPYRGTVIDITDQGTGSYDYFATIELDEESMEQPYIAAICPDGIMNCFSFAIDLLKE